MPEDFLIKVENASSLDYETNNIAKKTFNVIFIPILNYLPERFVVFIKKSNKGAKKVVENATTHMALEVLYNKGLADKSEGPIGRLFLTLWFNINNAKAVRNRLKLVKREFKKALFAKSETKDYIHILSIASGSARAIIEVLSDPDVIDKIDRDLISVTFVDKNPRAIEYSKELSRNVPNYNFNWVNDSAGNFFKKYGFKEKFDIIEIVGLLDYFDDEKVVQIFHSIYKNLRKGGVVIAANINHNSERKFVTKTIGWRMIYRSIKDLASLLNKAGFLFDNMDAYYEPLKIHSVVIAGKK